MATASLSINAESGKGIREYVAIALDVLDEMGIEYQLTPMATNMEGDVETICKALALIHRRCHERGAARVGSLLKIDDRVDVAQTLDSKVRHVEELRREGTARED
jgi:uncharacterized protein (TIGR00106 family)